MAKSLVIVESPTKAKTLKKYLGRNYQMLASVGHLKDLPKRKLGIDLEQSRRQASLGRLARTAAGWPLATAGKNELNTQHNLPVPYAVLMMCTQKTGHIAAGGL